MKHLSSSRRVRVGANGVAVVHESAPGGLRKLRCPETHQLAVPVATRDGSKVVRTPSGVTYVSKPLR
jgi:hypothetical protein